MSREFVHASGKKENAMVKRSMTGLVALVLTAIGFWVSFASLSLAASPTKLSLGMPTTPPNLVHIGPWVAKEQGFFTDEGLDVEITTFEGGVHVIRNVVSGGLDAGGGGGALGAGSVAEKAGIKPEEVTFIPIASADVPPLVAGQIDTAVLHVDQLMAARQKDPSFHPLVKFWELEPNQLFLIMVAQEKKLAADPAKYQALIRALVKANRFIYSDKSKTVEIAVKHAKIPRAVVEPAYDELVKGKVWAQNDGLPKAKVEYTIDRMVQVGSIKPEDRPKHEDYVALSILEGAMKRLPRVADYD